MMYTRWGSLLVACPLPSGLSVPSSGHKPTAYPQPLRLFCPSGLMHGERAPSPRLVWPAACRIPCPFSAAAQPSPSLPSPSLLSPSQRPLRPSPLGLSQSCLFHPLSARRPLPPFHLSACPSSPWVSHVGLPLGPDRRPTHYTPRQPHPPLHTWTLARRAPARFTPPQASAPAASPPLNHTPTTLPPPLLLIPAPARPSPAPPRVPSPCSLPPPPFPPPRRSGWIPPSPHS